MVGEEAGTQGAVAGHRGGPDAHRRHQRGHGADDCDRSRSGRVGVPRREALLELAAAVPAHGDFGRQAAEGQGRYRGRPGVVAAPRMVAVSLQRSHTALGAAFRNLARRKGYAVAVFAMAPKLAMLVYRMLRWSRNYLEIGARAYEACYRRIRLSGLKAAAKSLGYDLVEKDPSTPPHLRPSTA